MTKITIEQIKRLSKATVELEKVLKEIGLELDCGDDDASQEPTPTPAPKLKVGDEVLLPNGKFGKILSISGIAGHESALVSSEGVANASYKLSDLKMKPSTIPAPKFKVGDEVEISANRFGKILSIAGENATVDIDNESAHGSFKMADLKLKTPTVEIKIGDMVIISTGKSGKVLNLMTDMHGTKQAAVEVEGKVYTYNLSDLKLK